MLSITQSKDKQYPSRLKAQTGPKNMSKNDLSKTLDSALSTTFRTSLILNQVDSRLEELRIRGTRIDIKDNNTNDHATRDLRLDSPSNKNLNVDIWLQDMRYSDKTSRGLDNTRANNMMLMHENTSEYDKITEDASSTWKLLPETPISMKSNNSKLTSSSSDYSMDSAYSTLSNFSTFRGDPPNSHALLVSSAGRDSSATSFNNKSDSRLSDSSIMESKPNSFSLRGRVKSLGRKRKKSSIESSSITSSQTARKDEDKNANGKNLHTRTSLPNLQAFDLSPQKIHRVPIEFKPLNDKVFLTSTQPSGLKENDECYPNLEPSFSEAIPYSIPKQYSMKENDLSTTAITGLHTEMEKMDRMQHHVQEASCQDFESFAIQELECKPFDKDINLTAASFSWTASNVFEYYFDANASVGTKGMFDAMCPGYYEAEHVTLSMDNIKMPKLLPARFAPGHPVCPVNFSNYSVSTDDNHCDQYPLEIIRAYFRNE
ncbi:hypothetical protein NQZ79_g5100 [Umbelopsis isabellina]|nr:hypothetical protein NQZ79_g5100 [Umbelopsis isabellina]